jgi:hypothetical protein
MEVTITRGDTTAWEIVAQELVEMTPHPTAVT